ncbi:quinone-dependent dihydroorotate dehydrogenase [Enemella evansiae]|uniref:quinone-dependent dihydroorotate dehydrogenase n=1 Tax=Enemella evansiae TaxID=2016499 RepID=UPI001E556F3F|nr:quinone-dependent dihydroorotate dehydrogenase [Enemella evansiae]
MTDLRIPLLDNGFRRLLRPALFASGGGDPEVAHERTLRQVATLARVAPLRGLVGALHPKPTRGVRVAGIDFPGPVGLAAGLDKFAVGVPAWSALGFSHVELGTVTAHAQPGNEKPRLFRAVESRAIINRMGFNNPGAAAMAASLERFGVRRGNRVAGIPLGISLGKSKVTPLAEAVTDYLTSFGLLAPYADYIAINVSSPNTPGLRTLQDASALRDLLGALTAHTMAERARNERDEATAPTRSLSEERSAPTCSLSEERSDESKGPGFDSLVPRSLNRRSDGPVPIFVKVAPDLTFDALEDLLAVCTEQGASGLIATNTTLARDGLVGRDRALADQAGGLSGAPLTQRSREVVGWLAERTELPIIGVGGIMSADDARAMLDAGAALLQLYTGYIYGGPALVGRINQLTMNQLGER